MATYDFTNAWFQSTAQANWDTIVLPRRPTKILEIGSYEGASACYLIDRLADELDIELHCVDSWGGGIEHQGGGVAEADMAQVYLRFEHNITLAIEAAQRKVDLLIHRGYSDLMLAKLMHDGFLGYFDLVYIDGSHQAADVICDAVLAFKLLRIGGLMVFDDYLWSEDLPHGIDPLRCPKPAIDAFTNIFCRKLRFIQAPIYQLYLEKLHS
jgi:predicted O-methyltransferase YrrM